MLRQLQREWIKHAARKLGRVKRLPKYNRPREPKALQREYLAELLTRQRFAKSLVNAALPQLRAALDRARAVRGDAAPDALAVFRADDAPNDIQRELGQVKVAFQRRYSKPEAERVAQRMAARGRVYAAEEIQKQFRKVIGVDIVTTSPAIEQVASAAVIDNVSLIESIPAQYFADVEREVMTTLRTGSNTEDLIDLLQERYDVSESRATLIAVDQVNKLNGNLTQATQTQNGVTGYIWRTSEDERVRDTHRILDGKAFDWNDPPDVGHPGEDYRCRCQAEADIEGLVSSLEGDGGEGSADEDGTGEGA